MANVVATRVCFTGDLSALQTVLTRLAGAINQTQELGPLRDPTCTIEIGGFAPWTVPLEWVDALASGAVDIDVRGVELSNAWCQTWERRDRQWRLVDCREGVFAGDEDEEVVYVADGQVVSPLPEWVADPPLVRSSVSGKLDASTGGSYDDR